MAYDIAEAKLENCIYCGACFRYCVLGAYNDLDGEELKGLVAGVARIARKGPRSKGDEKIKELLDRCTLQGGCDKVCPAMVRPYIRNHIAKKRMEEDDGLH
jgi:L-lactate utilization protein LutB